VLTLIKVTLARLRGSKLHPRMTMSEEVGIILLRSVLRTIEPEVITDVLSLGVKGKKHPYPIKEVKTSQFTGHWYGVDNPDSKILLFIHGKTALYHL